MAKNLVIVESPAKAKTIEKFLGKDFQVKSSFGHVRDLPKSELSIDLDHDYKPKYEITSDKKKIIDDLSDCLKKSETVWLASDEDREGEAIAWHLAETLGLDISSTKRIVFHEITKPAIEHAIKEPRHIDINLVNAQQARRVLDRLVGYELSPVLWKKLKPGTSAGRVQSAAVRLIVDQEEKIRHFQSEFSYRITAQFIVKNQYGQGILPAEFSQRFATKEAAEEFLKSCIDATFEVSALEKKPGKKSPAPPFTTSTLQQEASRKLNFSVSKTMTIAQQLYESGKITYMRTDSVNLSNIAHSSAKNLIVANYGEKYSKRRQYTTNIKGAQEAHEAIRPTYFENKEIAGTADQKRLYDLIWKRTIASQMSDAEIEKTIIYIKHSMNGHDFVARGEVIKFDGFLKVYHESTDDESKESDFSGVLPTVVNGEILAYDAIDATQKFTQQPYRYTEASLVKKMEELGIGRPSTYAPTISTILKREYVLKTNCEGNYRDFNYLVLKNNKIKETIKKEKVGFEKDKLIPTDVGSLVNNYLMNNFEKIMDFQFTASVEKEFDEIAEGKMEWAKMIDRFYQPFHQSVKIAIEQSDFVKRERQLGIDPKSGKPILVKLGRYGAVAQIGLLHEEEKPKYAALKKTQSIETITLEEALDLFKLPRVVGSNNGEEIVASVGKFGPYIRYQGKFYSLGKLYDPMSITIEEAVQLIDDKNKADLQKILKTFENSELKIINGRYGAYISFNKKNYKIPKGTEVADLSLEACMEIISKAETTDKKTPFRSKKKRESATE
ncbi:MAG: type I DNA topoisomerase [Bacteroidales bacterium]|nr:type I DNA topoisomerase [Bacteroidales bacterium]